LLPLGSSQVGFIKTQNRILDPSFSLLAIMTLHTNQDSFRNRKSLKLIRAFFRKLQGTFVLREHYFEPLLLRNFAYNSCSCATP
jgi:hypothetical protein